MRISSVLALALSIALPATARAASLVYADRAIWEAAVTGPIYTETFDSLPEQHVESGVGGTLETPVFDILLPPGMVHGAFIDDGFFRGDLHVVDATVLEYNEFRFEQPITAFAADFLYIDQTSGVLITIGSETFRHLPVVVDFSVVPDSPTFFGVVSDTAVSSIVVRGGGSAPRIYDVDNVSIAPIPEPTSWVLLAIGSLVLLAFWPSSKTTR